MLKVGSYTINSNLTILIAVIIILIITVLLGILCNAICDSPVIGAVAGVVFGVIICWIWAYILTDLQDESFKKIVSEEQITSVYPNSQSTSSLMIALKNGNQKSVNKDSVICVYGESKLLTYNVDRNDKLLSRTDKKYLVVLSPEMYTETLGIGNESLKIEKLQDVFRSFGITPLSSDSLNKNRYTESEVSKERDELKIQKDNLENDKKTLKENKAELEKNKIDLENQVKALKEELSGSSLQDTKNKLYETEKKIIELEGELRARTSEKEELDKEVNNLTIKIERAKNRTPFMSTDFINICIGIAIVIITITSVICIIAYGKFKLSKMKMICESECKIREGLMLEESINKNG